ncbi:MAG: hypothetical protein NTW82_07690 [Bacteroidia bacterium]|nr:hypothetical protein [Bacteroidia bacterium]
MKKIAFFFVFSLVLFSCEKGDFPDPSTLPKGLAGSWVETHTLEDTIVFNSGRDTGWFYLSRGFEMRNGYRLPKIGSAPYSYIISGDSISVIDGLSSSMQGGTYYFRYDEPDLIINIGKFCKYIDTKKSTLIFRKIR